MKRLKKFLTTVAVATVAIVGTAFTAYGNTGDATADYQEVSVGKVEDINDMLDAPDNGIGNDLTDVQGEGAYTYYYKFTLDKPSFFIMKSYVDLVEYNFQGDMFIFLSTNRNFSEDAVITSWMNGEGKQYNSILEAGTYYIKVKCDLHDEPDFINARMFSIGLYAQEVGRTGDITGSTMKKAINLSSSAEGIISRTSRDQWFKFTVGQKSDVTIKTVTARPYQWAEHIADVIVYDKDGAAVSGAYEISGSNNSCEFQVKGLKKGTYYVLVAGKSGVCTVNQMVTVTDNYKPDVPKITSYKKNTKYIEGKGEAGTKVTVVYNGKSYKGTVKSNGKFKVTVAKLKSGAKVTVKLTDKAGNYSSKTVKVK